MFPSHLGRLVLAGAFVLAPAIRLPAGPLPAARAELAAEVQFLESSQATLSQAGRWDVRAFVSSRLLQRGLKAWEGMTATLPSLQNAQIELRRVDLTFDLASVQAETDFRVDVVLHGAYWAGQWRLGATTGPTTYPVLLLWVYFGGSAWAVGSLAWECGRCAGRTARIEDYHREPASED